MQEIESLYQSDFEEVTNDKNFSNEDLIKKLEEIFQALESNTDCDSELSGGYQSAEYCNKLVTWREVINQTKVLIKKSNHD